MPRVHKKVTLLTAGLFKYAWPFSGGHQELKGSNQTHYKHRGILIKPYTFPLIRFVVFHNLNTLSDYSTKRSITLKQFVDNSRWIVWVCLPILWGWCLKGLKVTELISRTSKKEEHWKLSKNVQWVIALEFSLVKLPATDRLLFKKPLKTWFSVLQNEKKQLQKQTLRQQIFHVFLPNFIVQLFLNY